MTTTEKSIIPGTGIVRQVGGPAGTNEVQVYHDGVNGTVISKLGNLSLQPAAGGKVKLSNDLWPSADGTNGQYLYTDASGNLNWAGYGTKLSFSAGTLSFAQSAALSVLGNATNATANDTDVTATASSNQVLMVSAAGTTLTWNTIQTANIAASAVTYAKIQNVTASRLLGNPTGAGAAPSEVVLGSNLSFSGGTLNATVAAGSAPVLNLSVFTASGTFNTPSTTTSSTIFKFTITGAGGGGGRCASQAGSSPFNASAGGGCGATCIYYASGLSGSNAISITIGAGGAGGTADNTVGTAGGTSSFAWNGTTITAGAGGGGTGAGTTSGTGCVAFGGTGGIGTQSSGTDGILINGGNGNQASERGTVEGNGGIGLWGGGGRGASNDASVTTGRNGSAYGSGGGGGQGGTPGTGAGGICTVEWVN